MKALQASILSGKGAVATTNLTTVANEFMGVSAGIDMTVTWSYLALATEWKEALPTEVQSDIDKGLKGPYPYFPNYPTDMITLTAPQVNLLANMATWIVLENKEQFQAIFSSS